MLKDVFDYENLKFLKDFQSNFFNKFEVNDLLLSPLPSHTHFAFKYTEKKN